MGAPPPGAPLRLAPTGRRTRSASGRAGVALDDAIAGQAHRPPGVAGQYGAGHPHVPHGAPGGDPLGDLGRVAAVSNSAVIGRSRSRYVPFRTAELLPAGR